MSVLRSRDRRTDPAGPHDGKGWMPPPKKNLRRVAWFSAAPTISFMSGGGEGTRRGSAPRHLRGGGTDHGRDSITADARSGSASVVCPPPPVAVRPVPEA